MRKIVETRKSPYIKDTSTIMRNPLPELCREGLRMIVLVSVSSVECYFEFFLHPNNSSVDHAQKLFYLLPCLILSTKDQVACTYCQHSCIYTTTCAFTHDHMRGDIHVYGPYIIIRQR